MENKLNMISMMILAMSSVLQIFSHKTKYSTNQKVYLMIALYEKSALFIKRCIFTESSNV